MAHIPKRLRDLPLLRRVESIVTRVVRVIEEVVSRGPTPGGNAPQSLEVEVLRVSFDGARRGTRRGLVQIVVINLSEDVLERLTITATLRLDAVGPVYTVEHTCRVHVEPGDHVNLSLDLGEVPLEDVTPGLTTAVEIIASRHVNKMLPMYVLPESSIGICAIEDLFMLARDILLQRIDIAVSRTFFGNTGWARVTYVMRNDSGISHSGLSIRTRFFAVTGEVIGSDERGFDLAAFGVSRVTAHVRFKRGGVVGASRFEAEVDGFEDIARGISSYRGLDGLSAVRGNDGELWEGEEVTGAYRIDRM